MSQDSTDSIITCGFFVENELRQIKFVCIPVLVSTFVWRMVSVAEQKEISKTYWEDYEWYFQRGTMSSVGDFSILDITIMQLMCEVFYSEWVFLYNPTNKDC